MIRGMVTVFAVVTRVLFTEYKEEEEEEEEKK
jgi:hypothetical protein